MALPALIYLPPNPILEASGNPTVRRAQRANRAALDVLKDRNAHERAAMVQLAKRLQVLQNTLKGKLLADDGSVTDFKRFSLNSLLADVDRIAKDTTDQINRDQETNLKDMADLGQSMADEPVRAAQLQIGVGLPGLDAHLVTSAFGNMADLLTLPMQQFATDVKVSLRRVALTGESRMAEIQRLRDQISGQGFDNAQYRAERIIRTELGRVFNESNYARLTAMVGDFPFLRKGWRSAADGRTRQGHREAAQKYARGSGAPMAEPFQVNVYAEKNGIATKLLGVARLRFPIDPQAQPTGRIAAAATILCRCNAFVDFDLSEFAQFTAQKIQQATGGLKPPIAAPPTPVPAPAPTRKPVQRKPRMPKSAPMPTPDLQKAVPTGSTDGPRVSASLVGPTKGALKAIQDRVMGAVDKVHSDGLLDKTPLKVTAANVYGKYTYFFNGHSKSIALSKSGLNAHPFNTLAHETGHWVDHQGLGGGFARFGSTLGQRHSPEMGQLIDALTNSKTIQQLRQWYFAGTKSGGVKFHGQQVTAGFEGDGTIPVGLYRKHIGYLLQKDETFARGYAQYIAVRSGDTSGLAELKMMQKACEVVHTGKVPAGTRMNSQALGLEPDPGTWSYPVVWTDEDFTPIADAFDRLFEAKGWRHPTKK
jgi:hypothetical protein